MYEQLNDHLNTHSVGRYSARRVIDILKCSYVHIYGMYICTIIQRIEVIV